MSANTDPLQLDMRTATRFIMRGSVAITWDPHHGAAYGPGPDGRPQQYLLVRQRHHHRDSVEVLRGGRDMVADCPTHEAAVAAMRLLSGVAEVL